MKKSLFAAAALTALAGAAQAQSSVTVYGILDVGYIGTNERVPQVGVTSTGTTATPAYKRNSNVIGQSAESTSRLGFKGTEDLGGGTSAFFTVEMQLYPNDANLEGGSVANTNTGTSANSYGGFINRQSFVGLKKNGIGEVAIGTQYTPVFNSGAKITAGQLPNIVGGVIYAGNGSGTTSAGYTNRLNNSITLTTDSFAGFKLNGIYQANNNTRSMNGAASTNATSGGTTNVSAWGIGADYQWKNLLVTAAYQSVQNDSPGTDVRLAATTYVPTNGYNVKSNEGVIGAAYDFGILKAYAGWTTRTVISTENSANYVKRSGQEIGVRSYITPTIEAWAQVGNGRYSAYGTSEPTANFIAYQLGSNYYLSKRTNLYGIFGSSQSSNTSSSTAFPNGAASGINQYAVGVRHTF